MRETWFIAEMDGRDVGVAKLAKGADAAESMHIESIWVKPEYRRFGVARALVERLELEAVELGESEVRLWVFETNPGSRDFFARLGYRGPAKRQRLDVGHGTVIEEEFYKRLV